MVSNFFEVYLTIYFKGSYEQILRWKNVCFKGMGKWNFNHNFMILE